MEDFRKGWEKLYAEWKQSYNLAKECSDSVIKPLKESISELEQLKSSEETRSFIKNYFGAVTDFLKPVIGLPYLDSYLDSGFSASAIIVDSQGRIKRIALEFGEGGNVCLVCENKRGNFTSYIESYIEQSWWESYDLKKKKKEKLSKYIDDEFMNMSFAGMKNRLSRLGRSLEWLVDKLPEPLVNAVDGVIKKTERVEKELSYELREREGNAKEFFMLKAAFSGLYKKISQNMSKTIQETARKLSNTEFSPHNIDFSIDEILKLGITASVEPEKLKEPVLAMFGNRDQRLPALMEELRRKNVESFHCLLKLLEAEVKKDLSDLDFLPFDYVKSELSYSKSCGVPVEEYKNSLIHSARERERKRRKETSKFLHGLEEI